MMPVGRLISVLVLIAAVVSCDRRTADAGASKPIEQRLQAGAGSVVLALDRDQLTTAGHALLTFEVTMPAGGAPVIPAPPEDLGGFAVVERFAAAPRLTADGGITASETWRLEPFLPGDYTIPSIAFAYTDPSGATGEVKSEPITVKVASELPADQQEATEIGAARGVVDAASPVPSRATAWAVGAAALLGVAGIGAGVWYLRRRQHAESDPCRAAEERLREMATASLPDPAGAVAEASALMRACLAARLDPSARTRTTEELLAYPALGRGLSEHDLGVLRHGLGVSDASKFAGAEVSESQARSLAADALGFVRSVAAIGSSPETARVGGSNEAVPSVGATR